MIVGPPVLIKDIAIFPNTVLKLIEGNKLREIILFTHIIKNYNFVYSYNQKIKIFYFNFSISYFPLYILMFINDYAE